MGRKKESRCLVLSRIPSIIVLIESLLGLPVLSVTQKRNAIHVLSCRESDLILYSVKTLPLSGHSNASSAQQAVWAFFYSTRHSVWITQYCDELCDLYALLLYLEA